MNSYRMVLVKVGDLIAKAILLLFKMAIKCEYCPI